MKYFFFILISFVGFFSNGQKLHFKDKSSKFLTKQEAVFRAFSHSQRSILLSKNYLDSVLDRENSETLIHTWKKEPLLNKWFGKDLDRNQIKKVLKRIDKLVKKTNRDVYFKIPNKFSSGLCKGSRHAWTIPFGKVKIHLCQQFFYKSNRHWTKIFIHELAHETGILFHQKVYWKGAALQAATENPERAIRNPENYAYFIMEFY